VANTTVPLVWPGVVGVVLATCGADVVISSEGLGLHMAVGGLLPPKVLKNVTSHMFSV
jgi:hypothetical protein